MGRRREQDDWFYHVSTEFSRLTEEMMRGVLRPALATRRFWEPRVDVYETPDDLIVKAEVAGVEPDSFHISLTQDQMALVIRGSRFESAIESEPRTGCYQLEIYYGDFEREVRFPPGSWDKENIRASYKSGFLMITVPRGLEIDEPPLPRTIPITE